jgi:hypothetical protein
VWIFLTVTQKRCAIRVTSVFFFIQHLAFESLSRILKFGWHVEKIYHCCVINTKNSTQVEKLKNYAEITEIKNKMTDHLSLFNFSLLNMVWW